MARSPSKCPGGESFTENQIQENSPCLLSALSYEETEMVAAVNHSYKGTDEYPDCTKCI